MASDANPVIIFLFKKMKSLIQNGYAGTGKPSERADLKSRVSDRGDPKMNSERLRLLLPRIKYPQAYSEAE